MTLPYELLAAESRIAPKTRRPRGARYVDFVKKHGVYIHICMYVSTWNTRSGESKCARARARACVCVCLSYSSSRRKSRTARILTRVCVLLYDREIRGSYYIYEKSTTHYFISQASIKTYCGSTINLYKNNSYPT